MTGEINTTANFLQHQAYLHRVPELIFVPLSHDELLWLQELPFEGHIIVVYHGTAVFVGVRVYKLTNATLSDTHTIPVGEQITWVPSPKVLS